MSLVKRNIIANFAGQGWVALMGFVFVPFYLKFIGATGYGLVGFFVLLSSTMALLDGGLGVTATRQTAAFLEADDAHRSWTVTLLRTIETLFWIVAGLTGVIVAFAAPLLSKYWLQVEDSRVPEVTAALRLMAATLVAQFPIAFYTGCMVGFQQQVKLNIINSVASTIRGLGAVLVLWLISPTVQAFFAWQCVLSLATVLVLRASFLRTLGSDRAAKWFDLTALRGVGK